LDTNICIYIINRRPLEIIHKFKQFNVGDIGISTITVSELQYGAFKSKNPKLNVQRVEEFIAPIELLPYDHNVANSYNKIRYNQKKRGKPSVL
jgi:tRNA(fMet)-specific endonuclease VapC